MVLMRTRSLPAGPHPDDLMDRSLLEQMLAQSREHVARGEEHLARQRLLIDELERDGHDSSQAWHVLRTLEETQSMHVAHRDRLLRQIEQAS
jgi:hypothetical protein